ncbi:substrate-binding periplasmic protein [Chitinimonas lacunae]|uniref:Substrate-binding periplasmic protein n=1 Tax=Chitinimonas lacunae TaxID=1963018 RepID=A0ABV8MSX0_9NEIS
MQRILSALLCYLVAGAVYAASPLKVCFDDWPPYAGYDARTGFSGITVALMRDLFGSLGIRIHFKSATQARCLAEARQGLTDVVLFSRRENLPGWRLTEVPTEFWLIGAWVPLNAPQRRFESISQFRDMRVGTVRDYIYPAPIAGFRDWRVTQVGDAIDALRQLSARRIDVVFDDVFWGQRMAAEKKLRIRMLEPLVAAEPEAHLYHPRHALLFSQFESLLNEAIRSGEVDRRYRESLGLSYDAVRKGHYHQAFLPTEANSLWSKKVK